MESADGTSMRSARPRLAAISAIVGVGALLPVVVTALGGGFGITRNDDYAFIATMRVLAEHGTFRLRGPADMTLIGQLVLAWPVARLTSTSTTALQLTTVVAGTVGLFAIAALARNVLDLKRSVLVALAVAVTPMWAPLATSFMTDVWALALGAVAAALVVRATTAASTRGFAVSFAGALAAASGAFLVRQTAAMVWVAVLAGIVVGLRRVRSDRPNRATERTVAGVLVAVSAVGCAVVYRWRSTMMIGGLDEGAFTVDRMTRPLAGADRALVSLALLLLPASVAFLRRDLLIRRVRALPRFAPVAAVTIGCIVVVKLITRPIDVMTLSDYASRAGPSSYTAPDARIPIVPWVPWALLIVAAAANLWALMVVLSGPGLRRCWRERPVVLTVAATLVVGTAVLFTGSWIGSRQSFDRYLLPIIPYASLLLAWVSVVDRGQEPGVAPAGVGPALVPPLVLGRARAAALGVLVALAAWFGLASASFDRAVHRAGEAARESTGAASSEIDAGMTVNGTWAADVPFGDYVVLYPDGGCWIVRQTTDQSEVVGPVLEHERLLWVERWFFLENAGGRCSTDRGSGG